MKVLLLVLGAALCQNADANPTWANEAKLGSYQDAWKSLQQDQNKRYYLAQATQTTDGVWGEEFTCVSVTAEKIGKKKLNATILYKNKHLTDLKESHETITVWKAYDYTTENGIKYETQGTRTQTFEDVFVFSDYKNCDVIFVPKERGSDEGDYELWVSEDKIDKIPDCCKFTMAYFAQQQEKTVRNVYTDSSCKPAPAQN
uniref:Male-specific histamine-binding salivary protein n=1 Tax=Rhipicephalus appendiculatus TaxID=34631 RepID=HBP3_RHIAP|nr:RecName: Full=Male-specific histamine-binding salivary protein; Short=MS-HBP; AltName: Full=RaHBP3; Flags: Precursor [Rhipicephalus appendiculatus]AAC63108.1 male-specific histamine-binding salivary protein [Rhipicephalus appendiculatus]